MIERKAQDNDPDPPCNGECGDDADDAEQRVEQVAHDMAANFFGGEQQMGEWRRYSSRRAPP